MILNNTDRINIMGQNAGNPQNLHFEVKVKPYNRGQELNMLDPGSTEDIHIKALCAIDNKTNPMTLRGAYAHSNSYDTFKNYMKAVENVI